MNDTAARGPRDVSIEITLEGRGSFSASGPDDLVFKALGEFREEVGTAAESAPTPPRHERPAGGDGETKKETRADTGKTNVGPLAPFMKGKAPKTNAEAVAIMTVWDHLTNATTEWSVDSIAALWRNASRPKAGNLGRDIDTAVKSGWLDRPSKGKYVWNQFGQDFVENDLPRQAKKA